MLSNRPALAPPNPPPQAKDSPFVDAFGSVAMDDTAVITAWCVGLLRGVFRAGSRYVKAGMTLDSLRPKSMAQGRLYAALPAASERAGEQCAAGQRHLSLAAIALVDIAVRQAVLAGMASCLATKAVGTARFPQRLPALRLGTRRGLGSFAHPDDLSKPVLVPVVIH